MCIRYTNKTKFSIFIHVKLILFLYNVQDGYEVRTNILGQVLSFKENEYEDNMPTGVIDFISCIRKIQTNMNVKPQGSKGN